MVYSTIVLFIVLFNFGHSFESGEIFSKKNLPYFDQKISLLVPYKALIKYISIVMKRVLKYFWYANPNKINEYQGIK